MRVHTLHDNMISHDLVLKNGPYNQSRNVLVSKKYIAILFVIGVVICALLAVAIIAPLAYSLNTSETEVTTTVTTDTTTTVTTVTATTSSTTTITTVTTTTTSTTVTTTTTRALVWNTTSYTVAGNSACMSGSARNFLLNPMGLALDSSNSIYIAEFQNHRISKWIVGATTGILMAGQPNRTAGASNNTLNGSIYVILDSNNNMYISDYFNHRIMYWINGASYGSVIAGITGSSGSGNNQLSYPTGLALDSATGTLYIADANNNRIMRYLSGASSGILVAGGNGAGSGNTQLFAPYGVSFNSSTSSLIIVNNGAHNVVRWVVGASSWTLLAGSGTGVGGSSSTLLSYPHNAVTDSSGNLYVSDTSNHRIQLFLAGQSNATTIAGVTNSPGCTTTQLFEPYYILLDSQGSLYVGDTNNNRIQKFP